MLSKKDFLFDKRLTERFIKRGLLTREEYRAHLQSLPDAADKSEPLLPDQNEQSESTETASDDE